MSTLDTLEYERFTYDETSSPPLALEEAVKKASEMRKSDPANFYRVEALDTSGAAFRIEKVSVASVYAEFLSRFTQRFIRHARLRKG